METAEKYNELDNFIERLGLTYGAVFVPFSKSRNKAEKNVSLNWKITIGKGRNELTTDYMQGIGHAPGYEQSWGKTDRRQDAYYKQVAETGEYRLVLPKLPGGKGAIDWYGAFNERALFSKRANVPQPLLRDILYSLIMDSDALNCATFEEWASNLGYDTDSREAERIYRDCLAIALKLKSIIGQLAMDRLQVLFQDY